MKTRVIAGFLLCACISLVTAAGSTDVGSDTEYAGEAVTIKVLFTSSSQTAKTKELLATDFNVKYPNIKVEWEDLSTAQIETKLISGFAAGGYNYDVISWHTPSTFAFGGFLEPLDSFMKTSKRNIKEELLPLYREYGVFNGKWYAIPWRSHIASTVLYNEAMYKAAGLPYPPKTWEELLENSRKFTTGNQYGFLFGGVTMMLRSDQGFPAWIINAGGELLDANLRPAFNKPEYVKGLELFRELIKYSPPGVMSYSVGEEMASYTQGTIAHMLMGNWALGDTNNPEKSKIPPGSSKIALLTTGGKPPRASIGGWTLSMPTTARNKAAAWKFIEWATSPEIEKKVMLAGGELNGCTQIALNDPEVQQRLPYLKEVLDIAKISAQPYVFPQIPETVQIRDILASWVAKALTGQVADQVALDSAAKEVEELLKMGGYYK
jgi:ABC-type glycerol-3-phosphate transport system substrate-binding protein